MNKPTYEELKKRVKELEKIEKRHAKIITKLKESEEKFRTLVDYSPAAVAIIKDYRYLYVNPSWEKLTGYCHKDLKTLNALMVVHPDEREKVRDRYIRRLKGEKVSTNYEMKGISKDGKVVWLDFSAEIIKYDGERALLTLAYDITERKETEKKLLDTQRIWEGVMSASYNSMLIITKKGVILSANEVLAKRFGSTKDDMKGKNIFDLIPPDLAKKRKKLYDRVKKTKKPVRFEDTRAGMVLDNSIYPILDDNGNVDKMAIFTADITKRKQTEIWLNGTNKLKEDLLSAKNWNEQLKLITNSIVDVFKADFARIWMVNPGDQCDSGCIHSEITEGPHVCRFRDSCLHLIASSGRYTHIDGKVHRRVPFGCYKIGRIAAGEESKFITNDVTNDQRVHDRNWAGKLGLVSFAGYRLLSNDGNPSGVLALFSKEPVTSEKNIYLEELSYTTAQIIQKSKAEEALIKSEERLALAIAVSGAGVYEHNIPIGPEMYHSRRWANILGYEKDELPDHNNFLEWVIGLIHQDDIPILSKAYDDFIEGITPDYNVELRIKHKSGKWIIVQGLSHAVERDENNNVKRLVGVMMDITERKEAEKEREEMIADLKKALDEVKTLKEFIPICANCRKVRDDKGFWQLVETYISDQTGSKFSHGICPECKEELYGDYLNNVNNE